MAERKVRVMHEGKEHDAVEVGVKESTERWNEYTLDDGTVLKLRVSLLGAVRLEGAWDNQNHPAYQTTLTVQSVVMESDPKFQKKVN